MTLPLPLVPFEESLLVDDRPSYPWNIIVRLRFSGRPERSALESAARTTVARHPLLSATVQRDGRRRLVWVPASDKAPSITWLLNSESEQFPPLAYIDPSKDFPLQLSVVQREESSDLIVHFPHVCADGIATFQLIGDLLLAYASAAGGAAHTPSLPPLDPRLLARRGDFGLTFRKFLRMAPGLAIGLSGARQFLMRKAAPLVPHEPQAGDSPLPPDYPRAMTHEFSLQQTAAVVNAARKLAVTVNDIMTRDLFLALGDWRQRQGIGAADQWLRMMVPVSLRSTADRLMPAANVMSTIFLDRQSPDFTAPDRLLQGIHEEMELIKRNNLGLIWVLSLRVCRHLPGGIQRVAKRQHCVATAILTNLSKPLNRVRLPRREGRIVAANLVLEGMDILPPIRPYTCVALAVFSYARKLCISMHYDPRVLTAAQAGDLLATYVQRVGASTQASGPSNLD